MATANIIGKSTQNIMHMVADDGVPALAYLTGRVFLGPLGGIAGAAVGATFAKRESTKDAILVYTMFEIASGIASGMGR